MNEEFTEEQRRAVAAALQALQPVKGKRSTAIYIDDFAVHWHPTDKVRVLKLHPRREVAYYPSLAAMSEVLDSHPQAQVVAPPGFVMVPLEPTQAMSDAWNSSDAADYKHPDPKNFDGSKEDWAAWAKANASKDWCAMVAAYLGREFLPSEQTGKEST